MFISACQQPSKWKYVKRIKSFFFQKQNTVWVQDLTARYFLTKWSVAIRGRLWTIFAFKMRCSFISEQLYALIYSMTRLFVYFFSKQTQKYEKIVFCYFKDSRLDNRPLYVNGHLLSCPFSFFLLLSHWIQYTSYIERGGMVM